MRGRGGELTPPPVENSRFASRLEVVDRSTLQKQRGRLARVKRGVELFMIRLLRLYQVTNLITSYTVTSLGYLVSINVVRL